MTLLLIDIGNTRIKWVRMVGGRMQRSRAAAHSGWDAGDFARRVVGKGWRVAGRRATDDREAIVVCSVAKPRVNRMLVSAARTLGAPRPRFVTSQRRAAGISTVYIEPWRLGVDRFVAAIGAHHLACGNPVCIASVGTAMTIDLIDPTGKHLGGAIIPGPELMVSSLLRNTSGIRRRALGGATGRSGLFARSTRAAINQGAVRAAAAFIDRAVVEAHRELNQTPLVLLTGGGADRVQPFLRCRVVRMPDLVLHGLAVWARSAERL